MKILNHKRLPLGIEFDDKAANLLLNLTDDWEHDTAAVTSEDREKNRRRIEGNESPTQSSEQGECLCGICGSVRECPKCTKEFITPQTESGGGGEKKYTYDEVLDTLKHYKLRSEADKDYDALIITIKENIEIKKQLQALQSSNDKLVANLENVTNDLCIKIRQLWPELDPDKYSVVMDAKQTLSTLTSSKPE